MTFRVTDHRQVARHRFALHELVGFNVKHQGRMQYMIGKVVDVQSVDLEDDGNTLYMVQCKVAVDRSRGLYELIILHEKGRNLWSEMDLVETFGKAKHLVDE